MIAALVAGLGMGIASAMHCAAMCGPLAAASCTRDGAVDGRRTAAYSLARVGGYTVVGAIAGAIAAPLTGAWQTPLRLAAAILVSLLVARAGIRLLRPRQQLVQLRRKGRAFPPALLGLLTAVFPCGASFAAVLVAAASGGVAAGASVMLAFAVASAPGLLLTILGVGSLTRWIGVRRIAGVALLGLAGVTMVQAVVATRPKPHACCARRG